MEAACFLPDGFCDAIGENQVIFSAITAIIDMTNPHSIFS